MRPIDADKVMKEIARIGGHNLCEWETIGVKALIDRQPTIDAVPVVRCIDCKHWGGVTYGFVCRRFSGIETKACMGYDDYCSYGERKDGKAD